MSLKYIVMHSIGLKLKNTDGYWCKILWCLQNWCCEIRISGFKVALILGYQDLLRQSNFNSREKGCNVWGNEWLQYFRYNKYMINGTLRHKCMKDYSYFKLKWFCPCGM